MRCWVLVVLVIASIVASSVAEENEKKKHHHRRHHRKHHLAKATGATHHASQSAVHVKRATFNKVGEKPTANQATPAKAQRQQAGNAASKSEEEIVNKMRALEKELGAKEKQAKGLPSAQGQLEVNGPLPFNFPTEFAANVAKATGSNVADVRVVSTNKVQGVPGDIEEVHFAAPARVVADVEDQASDPESKLASGALHNFLVAKDDGNAEDEPAEVDDISEKKGGKRNTSER